MDPLSLKTRRWYSIISSVTFVFVLVFAILYATGYHLKGLSVVETGAIHVSVPVPDAVITLNGKEVGKSGLLTRALFLDNLAPGPYLIEATAEGYYPWAKNLVVAPKIVTEVPAFLAPLTFTFEKAAYPKFATSTPVEGGLALSVKDGVVTLRWTRSTSTAPAAFCIEPESCVKQMVITNAGATDAAFFDGGIIYQTPQGIYFAEADVKEPRLTVPLSTAPGATFRINRNRLYLKTATSSFEVSGF
jgi:hypothetical protein